MVWRFKAGTQRWEMPDRLGCLADRPQPLAATAECVTFVWLTDRIEELGAPLDRRLELPDRSPAPCSRPRRRKT